MRALMVLCISLGCGDSTGSASVDLSTVSDLSAASDFSTADLATTIDMTLVCAPSGPAPKCAGGAACDPGCWCAPELGIIPFDGGGGTLGPATRRCVCGDDILLYMQGMTIGYAPFCCGGQVCDGSLGITISCSAENDCHGM